MPAKSHSPSLLNVKPGSCNPSPSHSRRVLEGLSSLLDNLKYCRPKEDVQLSLVPRRTAACVGSGYQSGRSSSSSNSSSNSSSSCSSEQTKKHSSKKTKQRRSEQLELCRVLPNSGNVGSNKVPVLLEVGRLSHSLDEMDEGTGDLQPVVDELSSSDADKRRAAAEQVKRMAKSNPRVGMALVKLGAIAPLIAMLESGNDKSVYNSALLALLNLAIGTNVNKAAIVTAGAIPKMVSLSQDTTATSVQENLAGLFLSLSALDVNKPVIGHSGAVPALITILKQGSLKAKKDTLKCLYNLSIFHGNVKVVVDANIIQSLLDMIYHPELVETAVDLMGNLSATEAGRRAIIEKQDAVLILVDVLGWADAPRCQEKAVSVLMTMAHRSRALRQAIARCGAVAALLELSMLGSSVAQRVASWMLDCLKQDEELGKISKNSSSALELEEAHPGKFVHRILQQRSTGTREPVIPSCREVGQDISDHFISITL